ncbi:reverse transcriptase domain-containing protein [Tanacetum coccineum]
MRTRSQSRNLNRQQQQAPPAFVEPFNLEEPIENPAPPVVTMDDNRTMAQLLEAPTEGYEDVIVVPEITSDNFELKHGLLTLVQNKQFFGHDKEDPHAHIRYFNKITSTMKFPNVPSTSVKLMLFPFSLEGAARIWLEKEPPRSILTWDDLVSKFINKFFPPSKTTNLQMNPRFQQRFDETFYEAWDRFNDLLRACMGSLPSNTVTNSKEDLKGITTRSGVAYQGPTIPTTSKVVEHETEVTKDTMLPTNNGSTKDVQPLVVQDQPHVPNSEAVVISVSALMPNLKLTIPYPSRRNDERRREKANDQIEKFYEIFKDLSFKISLTDALILMPKFASTLKALIGNKEKLSEMARTPLNEHCSVNGELTLRVGKEAVTFNLDQTSRYSANYDDMTANRIDVIEMACEEYSQEVLGFSNLIASGNPTPYCDPIVSTSSPTLTPFGDSDLLLLEEVDAFLALEDDPTSPEVDDSYYDSDNAVDYLGSTCFHSVGKGQENWIRVLSRLIDDLLALDSITTFALVLRGRSVISCFEVMSAASQLGRLRLSLFGNFQSELWLSFFLEYLRGTDLQNHWMRFWKSLSEILYSWNLMTLRITHVNLICSELMEFIHLELKIEVVSCEMLIKVECLDL